ncbi:MAG: hypothetical protein KH230_02435 [Enterocloster asparagiformis]|nr:hypothetical protein [Enterocloster asparagiformis]
MLYHTFLSAIRQQMQKRLGDEYVLTLHRIPRNNGLCLDGLSICGKGSRVAPTIYLNTCYQRFQNGTPLNQILDELVSLYRQSLDNTPFDLNLLECAASVRPRVAFRLINAQSNCELLKTLPHIPVLDLAKVFYLDLGADGAGTMTVRITNAHLDHWDMDLETLNRLADHNTPRLFPARISSIEDALGDLLLPDRCDGSTCFDPPAFSGPDFPLYILSNQSGFSGAACMLYPDILKDFADRMKANLVVLPSSIHEVLLLPDRGDQNYMELCRTVASINRSEVDPEERLSNHAYLFSRSTGRLRMAPVSPNPL